jgi:tyrosyl-tRNA synthetase
MKLSEELAKRGFVGQITADSLSVIVDDEKRVIYHGIDPTADSAHAGNFVIWMLLRHLMAHGHTVVFLVGGGTGMIGDPKPDTERPLADREEVAVRVGKIKEQAERLVGAGGSVDFVDNNEWLSSLSLIEFLRDTGKHFTVNELIKKDAIARRLEGEVGLSYTEFAYPLLQAYDYLTLYRQKGCTVQVGGSDQWGNIVAGVDLIRRTEQVTVHALTVPLIVDKITGKKFGKSEGNAVWLSAEKTSPFAFYQFWFNTSDENVVDYLKLFTLIPLSEIEMIAEEVVRNPGARVAQRKLAEAVTSLVHGELVCGQVAKVSECLFGEGRLDDLTEEEKTIVLANAPVVTVSAGEALVDVLVTSGLATSKREARTFIESGAVTLDGKKITTVDFVVEADVPLFQLKRGKKNVSLIQVK